MAALGAECYALCGSAGCGISNCKHGDYSTDDDRCSTGAPSSADKGIAITVVGFHTDCRHGQVGTINCDHGCLSETGFRVEFLNGRVDRDKRYDKEDDEIDLQIYMISYTSRNCIKEEFTVIAAWFIEHPL